MKKYIIFGAGQFGRMALSKYGDSVKYFIDNNKSIQGNIIDGITVESLENFLKNENKEEYTFVIATRAKAAIEEQLKKEGITDYIGFPSDYRAYYDTEDVVYNPYAFQSLFASEEQWNERLNEINMIKEVDELTEQLYHNQLLFDHVEIETINRCNGICDFCPVSKQNDIREYRVMREELFKKIVEELAEMNYGGKIALFSNNEPFLDDRIIEWNKYAREKIKNARIHLFTNGTLLTLDKFISIIDYLDELIIDNYTLNGQLLRTCKDICDYCNVHEELKSKVTIVMRNPHEILSSRGGSAPNRSDIKEYKDNRCALPFRQMIIRPSGEVSLCCNDPLGKYTLGDVNVQTLSEIWYGEKFNNIRKRLYLGRKNIEACSRCDNISLG